MTTSRPRHRLGGRRILALLTAAVVGGAVLAGCSNDHKPAGPSTSSGVDASLHSRLPARIRDAGVIRVATDASYAPASFFGPDGHQIVGFEPDLAEALGKLLGIRFEFTNMDFSTIIDLVSRGTYDVAISAMTDTTEREKQLDFVTYFAAGTSIVVQRGNPAGIGDLKDLCGKRVAVEDGTVQVDLLSRAQANCTGDKIHVLTYPQNSDALLQVRTGRASAVLNDYPPASYLVNSAKTKAYYQLASTAQYEPGQYGIGVNKADVVLRDVLRDGMNELIADHRYDEVLAHWDVTEGSLKQASINAAS